jgi:hypothetical protein
VSARYARSSTTNAAHRLPRSPQAASCALATRRATRRTLPGALPAVMRRACQPAAGCFHGNAAATLGRLLPAPLWRRPAVRSNGSVLVDAAERPPSLRWVPAQRRGGGAVRRCWLNRAAFHQRSTVVCLVSLYPTCDTACRRATGCQQAAVRPTPPETCQPSSQHPWHIMHGLWLRFYHLQPLSGAALTLASAAVAWPGGLERVERLETVHRRQHVQLVTEAYGWELASCTLLHTPFTRAPGARSAYCWREM